MFRYTTVNVIFGIVLFALIIQIQYEGFNVWWLLALVLVYLFILVIGSVKIGYNFYFRSLCKIKTDQKEIALTFDDGPDNRLTNELLSLLDENKVPATFFCIGKNLKNNRALLKKMSESGHVIGNHSFTHHHLFDLYGAKKMTAEINATNKEIERVIGKRPILFRPPYGVTNPMLKKAIETTDMYSIGWSLRSFDTVKSPEKTIKKLIKKTRPGSVVLLHDPCEHTVAIVREYLKWLKEHDYKVVSLGDLFNIEVYETI